MSSGPTTTALPASPRIVDAAGALRLALGWATTRAVLLVALVGGLGYPHADVVGDIGLYRGWATDLVHGHVPPSSHWQYPPAAGAPIALPHLISVHYDAAFVLMALALDAAVLVLLARATSARHAAPWTWVLGVTVLGPVALARYDVAPTLAAVAALLMLRRGLGSGLAAGVGAALKLWPVVVVAAVRRGERRRWIVAFTLAAGALELACAGLFSGGRSPLANASGRRLEVESVPATPFVVARALGAPVGVDGGHGAQEIAVPGSAALAIVTLCLAAVGGAFVVIAAWRRTGSTAVVAPAAALAIVLVASPVLSAQYLLWLVGVGAATVASDGFTRAQVWLLLLAAALTQAVFPFGWTALIDGTWWAAALLVARNGVLVLLCARLVRSALRPAAAP